MPTPSSGDSGCLLKVFLLSGPSVLLRVRMCRIGVAGWLASQVRLIELVLTVREPEVLHDEDTDEEGNYRDASRGDGELLHDRFVSVGSTNSNWVVDIVSARDARRCKHGLEARREMDLTHAAMTVMDPNIVARSVALTVAGRYFSR